MSVESTRETMLRYFNSEHGDTSMMVEDVVFTVMATGQEYRGRDGVMGMLSASTIFITSPLMRRPKRGSRFLARTTP